MPGIEPMNLWFKGESSFRTELPGHVGQCPIALPLVLFVLSANKETNGPNGFVWLVTHYLLSTHVLLNVSFMHVVLWHHICSTLSQAPSTSSKWYVMYNYQGSLGIKEDEPVWSSKPLFVKTRWRQPQLGFWWASIHAVTVLVLPVFVESKKVTIQSFNLPS